MNNVVNVGVVGLGQMGMHHANIYKKLPGVRLYAVCDFNDEHRELGEKKFNCKGYKTYQEMLKDSELDAVSICLPDNMHLEAVEIAVANNKHILLEKPIAKDLEDGKKIYEITKNYNKVFTVGFLLRFDPRFCAIKDAIENDEIGEIVHLYCRRNSPIYGPKRYIGASDLSMHVMIHDIDYINWYMGCEPVKVIAKSRSVALKEYGMNDVIYAIATYENGAIVCMEACWTLPENSPTIIDDICELVGTKGTAYIDSCDKGVRLITPNKVLYPDTRHFCYSQDIPTGDLAEQLLGFISCIVDGKNPKVSAYEAYASLKVVDAIERSLKEGKEVSL